MSNILQHDSSFPEKIAVIGLGYVGLPLAIALARHCDVTGFDIDQNRIQELNQGHDRTHEVTTHTLKESPLQCTHDPDRLQGHSIFIITVPTPVASDNTPDLTAVKAASQMVGQYLAPGCIIVFESTVYPGVTEDICGTLLESASGLKAGKDFFLGYSPERMNPGDTVHTVDKIVKVVAGQTPAVSQKLAELYGTINNNQIFIAANIKTAEAAKVIENAQRDINIAFINEIAMIFNKAGLSVHDVLEAAQTKWNFLPFQPGLVGGHCIGVDPYYLASFSSQNGHNPEVILSGRRINDQMGTFLAAQVHAKLNDNRSYGQSARILILGLTFKENVPDLRNTKVVDIVQGLQNHGHQITIHDPLANIDEAKDLYGLTIINTWDALVNHDVQSYQKASGEAYPLPSSAQHPYDALICAVPHQNYCTLTPDDIAQLLKPNGLILDLKGIWSQMPFSPQFEYWKL